ncbi:CPBP family intramembrane glutamic endopeptidase [Mechercharimyces sp. CAU 1602]|uniref:CPBP family intramembrane glutamic endopeptidase n=1 Tax=Mechercharimyces sp. CAU 1602 TaxID=2973933 RepID=UPI002161EC4D|nr:type II CAAX endopeptidase family protein [Mechercharimyces sp. CAU 1602]MCS1350954.1 CPBP family intramembrane metalloprotease [Mechercharimyces sp. CAU 1602]
MNLDREQLWEMRPQLLLSVWFTQGIILLTAIIFLIIQGRLEWKLIFDKDDLNWIIIGIGVGLLIVIVDVVMDRFLPARWLDDGGINEALFWGRSIPLIALIAFVVSIAEELLFRGVLQHWLGVVGASCLFVLIHVRYLRRWVLMLTIFCISLTFGWMVEWKGTLAPAIAAHFVVDFVLGVLLSKGILPVKKK